MTLLLIRFEGLIRGNKILGGLSFFWPRCCDECCCHMPKEREREREREREEKEQAEAKGKLMVGFEVCMEQLGADYQQQLNNHL